jgi:hypothetical protein
MLLRSLLAATQFILRILKTSLTDQVVTLSDEQPVTIKSAVGVIFYLMYQFRLWKGSLLDRQLLQINRNVVNVRTAINSGPIVL